MVGLICRWNEQLYRFNHFNFVDNFNREFKHVNDRHEEISKVSNFSKESIIASKQWFLISVLLIFSDVKLLNFSIKRRFVGMALTADVDIVEEFVELNSERGKWRISMEKIYHFVNGDISTNECFRVAVEW